MVGEQGIPAEHSTLNRWVITSVPEGEKQCRLSQRPVDTSWRRKETEVRVKGEGKYISGPRPRRANRGASLTSRCDNVAARNTGHSESGRPITVLLSRVRTAYTSGASLCSLPMPRAFGEAVNSLGGVASPTSLLLPPALFAASLLRDR
jgi:hypothetical protein